MLWRRILFLCIFSMVSVSAALSQSIGIYGSVNNTNLEGDNPRGFKFVPDFGFDVGAYIDLQVSESVEISFQPGFFRANSKVQVRDRINVEQKFKDSLKLTNDFFYLPIQAKILFLNSQKAYFTTGVQLGYKIETRVKIIETDPVPSQFNVDDDTFEDFNVALNFGVGYRFDLGPTIFFVEMKYVQGLNNITDFNNPEELFTRVKSQGFQWTFGIGLPMKKKVKENEDE